MSELVDVCSKKWSDKNKCYLCECDSNWITNMFLDYSNNYIKRQTFIDEEVLPLIAWRNTHEHWQYSKGVENLLNLYQSIGVCNPYMLSHERIGEICIKILKGEF